MKKYSCDEVKQLDDGSLEVQFDFGQMGKKTATQAGNDQPGGIGKEMKR